MQGTGPADKLRAEAGRMVTLWKAICAQSFQEEALLLVVVVTDHVPSWILAANCPASSLWASVFPEVC